MADIDIVPKRRSGMWLWVILALIVVIALVFGMTMGSDTVPRSGSNPGAVYDLA